MEKVRTGNALQIFEHNDKQAGCPWYQCHKTTSALNVQTITRQIGDTWHLCAILMSIDTKVSEDDLLYLVGNIR